MKKKTQVLIVLGGMTFKSRKNYLRHLKTRDIYLGKKVCWHGEYLEKSLGRNFEITVPRMPLADNAKYEEWKIFFERFIPLLKNNVILIGLSLGGIFLAKYLSENKFPKKILSVYLIGAPYDNSLPGEDLVGGFKLKADLSLLEKNCKNIYFMFSKDDDVVPIAFAEKFRKKLKRAQFTIYENKNGHFKIKKFSEIVKMIKSDVTRKSRKII